LIFKSNNRKSGFIKAACLGLALLTVTPAFANVTRVSELVDVDPNVWAYKALKELVEKYDVLEGYPDSTFRGNKPATRYELAQALYEVLKVVDLAKAEPDDVDALGKLSKEYDKELADIRNRVAALEGRVSALEADAANVSTSWTDKIKLSGDMTNILQTDWGTNSTNPGQWGTRARIGIDAELIDGLSHGHLGEGIAHFRLNAGNGGPGTFGFNTSATNINDVLFDGTNPGALGNNNSLFSGRTQDSRMSAYLDQAYYTQVFKFSKTDPCSNETTGYDNIFVVTDLGQQDLWNTFHKSLVREDSLDGFINQRILQGMVGGSNGVTEAFHVGLNILGDGIEKEKTDECGNVTGGGVDECGQPLPGFFQAFALDFAFAANKNPLINTQGLTNVTPPGFFNGVNATTTRVWDSNSYSLAASLLYDIPGSIFNTGLFSVGASGTHVDYNSGALNPALALAGLPGVGLDDTFGVTVWTKLEQFFGKNRTFGWFADYAWAANSKSNYLVNGPVNQLIQTGFLLNTTFLPETWNFNKDQFGLAYSIIDPFNSAANNTTPFGLAFTGSGTPSSSLNFANALYIGHRPEQIIEGYYRKYVTENISITPDFQIVLNGNGHNTGVAGILRATFKLPNWNDGGAFDQFGYRDWSQRVAKYKAVHSKE
jgi:hypothetical protein